MMRILVARPREDAERLAQKLSARGHEPIIEPFLAVLPGEETLPPLDGVQALLFTSANGVRAFAAASDRRDIRALAVGDQTARVAREAGLTVESAGGTVEDLARLAIARLKADGGALLHVAGSVTAGDLHGALGQAGFTIKRVALYRVEPVEKLSDAVVEALKARKIDIVLLFSPRSAQLFHLLVSAAGVAEGCRAATLIGLSRAVIEAGASLPWAHRIAAAKPDEDGLLAVIDALPANRARAVPAPPPEIPREGETMTTARPVWPWLVAGLGLGALAVTAWVWTRDSDFALATRISALEQRVEAPRAAEPDPRIAALEERLRALPAPAADPAPRLDALERRIQAMPEPASDLPARVSALEARVQALPTPVDVTPRVEALERRPAPSPVDLATVNARITALEQRAQAVAPAQPVRPAPADAAKPEDVEIARRLAALEERVAALSRTAPAPMPAPPPTSVSPASPTPPVDLAPLRAEIAALGQRIDALPRPTPVDLTPLRVDIATLQGRVAALPPPVDLAPLNAELAGLTDRIELTEQRLALSDLRAAVARGGGFAAELEAAQRAFPAAAPGLALLTPAAARGVPSRAALVAAFPAMAEAAMMAERGEDPRLWRRTLDRALAYLRVRPAGNVVGDDTAAILARAENQLRGGDLQAALETIERLRGPAAVATQTWRGQAGLYLVTQNALATLAAATGSAP